MGKKMNIIPTGSRPRETDVGSLELCDLGERRCIVKTRRHICSRTKVFSSSPKGEQITTSNKGHCRAKHGVQREGVSGSWQNLSVRI